MAERAINTIRSNLQLARRVTRSLFRPPTAEEVSQAIFQLRYLCRTLLSLSHTIDRRGLPTTNSEIGEQSLSITQPTEIHMQSLSIIEPSYESGAQSSMVTQTTNVSNLVSRAPTTLSHVHTATLVASFLCDNQGQRLVAGITSDNVIWNRITENPTFQEMFSLESLPEGETDQMPESFPEGESDQAVAASDRHYGTPVSDSESDHESHAPLDSDSNTGNEGVQGSGDTLLMKTFKMFLRIMSSISGVSDILSVISATRTAPAPAMQPTPSGIFDTGTTPAAPSMGTTNNIGRHLSSSIDDWRAPSTSGTPTGYGSTDNDFEDPLTDRKRVITAVVAVVLFIILKRVVFLL